MSGRSYDSPHQKLREEFQVLMGRNNDILRRSPAYTVSQLLMLVDRERTKHGVELVELRDEGGGVYTLLLEGGGIQETAGQPIAAAIGVADKPERLEGLDVAMLDDTKLGGGP